MTKQEAIRLGDVLRLAHKAERVAPRVWAVPSRSEPEVRVVRVWANGAARCDCEAARYGRACCHIAAVLLARHWQSAARKAAQAQQEGGLHRAA